MKRSEPNRKLNICVARGVPVFLLGIIGYASWVVTKKLCVEYLLNPPLSIFSRKQTGAAIAILVIYYLLLFYMLVCYGRLLDVVTRQPGLVPRGRQWYIEKQRKELARKTAEQGKTIEDEKSSESDSTHIFDVPDHLTGSSRHSRGLRLDEFWKRDVFACKYDGRPDFCSTCYNWKPDRAHHCSELNRCVLKMDHFCPWVGGVVGETSFKFFVQFTFWGAMFCLHAVVSIAYFMAQRKHTDGTVDVHWAIALGLSGLFLLFGAGMFASSVQFAFINSTTIENLSRKQKVWCLAIHVPTDILENLQQSDRDKLRLITYPRPLEEQRQMLQQDNAHDVQAASQSASPVPVNELRTFGIFETAPGANPWNLGYAANFRDVMGHNFLDWFIPYHLSPCTNHESMDCFYKTGPVVQGIKEKAGIAISPRRSRSQSHSTKRNKRHSRRRGRSRSDPEDTT